MLKAPLFMQKISYEVKTVVWLLFLVMFSFMPYISMAEDTGIKKRTLALEAGFIGNNHIYFSADGQAKIKNSLSFYIRASGNLTGAIAAQANQSYIKISFDYGNEPGDLATETIASSINLDITRNYDNKFSPPKKIERGGRLFWELKPKDIVFLLGGNNNRIELQFSDIMANQHEGLANMYIEYGNLPDYRDGRLSLPIVKQKAGAVQMKYGLYLGNRDIDTGPDNFNNDIDPGPDNLKMDGEIQLQHGGKINRFSADATLAGNSDQTLATEKAIKTYVDTRLPAGVIVMWSGAIDNIPSGWVLCDGNNSTPDLRNAFILGSGDRAVHDKGGQENVVLTVEQMPEHRHTGSTGNLSFNEPKFTTEKIRHALNSSRKYANGVKSVTKNTVVNLDPAGKGLAHDNMPPFYVLAYIMKKDD